ncbi:MAG TPA: SUMF1/EgtB/PvdO family nonheme iron enzyme, partial [Luteolibacter sp.]
MRAAFTAVMMLCFAGCPAYAGDPPGPYTNTIGIRMLPVAQGKIEDLETLHEGEFKTISIEENYHLGLGEVTIAQWKFLMDVNPDFPDGSNRADGMPLEPIGGVRFHEAIEFCRRLTARERQTGTLPEGYAYRLPTEEQWEFACRSGSK